jgi:hypothetical protein
MSLTAQQINDVITLRKGGVYSIPQHLVPAILNAALQWQTRLEAWEKTIPSWAVWCARNEDGEWFFFDKKPASKEYGWYNRSVQGPATQPPFADLDTPWDKSLFRIKRA